LVSGALDQGRGTLNRDRLSSIPQAKPDRSEGGILADYDDNVLRRKLRKTSRGNPNFVSARRQRRELNYSAVRTRGTKGTIGFHLRSANVGTSDCGTLGVEYGSRNGSGHNALSERQCGSEQHDNNGYHRSTVIAKLL
jgi:hypothetical protein